MRLLPNTGLRLHVSVGTRPDEDFFLAGPHSATRRLDRDRHQALLAEIRRQPRRGGMIATVSALR